MSPTDISRVSKNTVFNFFEKKATDFISITQENDSIA